VDLGQSEAIGIAAFRLAELKSSDTIQGVKNEAFYQSRSCLFFVGIDYFGFNDNSGNRH
jgi:hypothetical protein